MGGRVRGQKRIFAAHIFSLLKNQLSVYNFSKQHILQRNQIAFSLAAFNFTG